MSKIEIIKAVSDEDLRWFGAQFPQYDVVGFMKETWEDGVVSRVIIKAKPGCKGWTPYGTARDCGDHYIIARYSRYDRVEKAGLQVTENVEDE